MGWCYTLGMEGLRLCYCYCYYWQGGDTSSSYAGTQVPCSHSGPWSATRKDFLRERVLTSNQPTDWRASKWFVWYYSLDRIRRRTGNEEDGGQGDILVLEPSLSWVLSSFRVSMLGSRTCELRLVSERASDFDFDFDSDLLRQFHPCMTNHCWVMSCWSDAVCVGLSRRWQWRKWNWWIEVWLQGSRVRGILPCEQGKFASVFWFPRAKMDHDKFQQLLVVV